MKITEIAEGIHYVGVNDRSKHKFENLWPLPYGVSYNAYLITDEKNVLVDTADAAYTDRLLDHITEIIGDGTVDYLVINHMEPDHSASIQFIRQKYPHMTIVGNAKTLEMVKGYYGIDDNTLCIKNGDTLTIGKRSLTFYLTPMVHWPETMMTYCNETGTLFSGDAFGCFGTLDGGIKDTQLNTSKYWDEMYRYYSNIVGKYGSAVQTALKKLACIDIKTICSTHGPVWEQEVSRVIDIYDRLSRYESEPGVVISGMSNIDQVQENLSYAKKSHIGMLGWEDHMVLGEAAKRYREFEGVTACTGCNNCAPCPKLVAIGSLIGQMWYIYKVTGNKKAAQAYYNNVPYPRGVNADACDGCGECLPKCPMHVDIPKVLKEMRAELKA